MPKTKTQTPKPSESNIKVVEVPLKSNETTGSKNDDFNMLIMNQLWCSLWMSNSSESGRDQRFLAAASAMRGISPKDELEGMMAAQMVGLHNAAMECMRRAMIGEQTFEGRKENLSQANKLTRSYAALVEALSRYRGKSTEQKVIVEHVNVHAGGQAIVGSVRHEGGGVATQK